MILSADCIAIFHYLYYVVSTIQSSASPTSNHIMAPDILHPPYCFLSLLPPTTSWLLIHCVYHTVLCLSYLQPHPGYLHPASTIQSSVSPTSSHILATYTLPPPYSPLSLLPLATTWLLTHCLRHTVHCLSYLQPHPGYLHTASTIQSSVSLTYNHILAPDTLRPPYYPLSLLSPVTPWLLTHCLHHTVFCIPYLQPHPGSLNTASATFWLLIHCVHHNVICLSYLQPHPDS